MDRSIGLLLDALQRMDLESNTLVVFTSDNGHEMGSGQGAIYKEGKRSLMVTNLTYLPEWHNLTQSF